MNVVSVKRLRHNDAIPVIHLYVVIGLSAVGLGVGVAHLHGRRQVEDQKLIAGSPCWGKVWGSVAEVGIRKEP